MTLLEFRVKHKDRIRFLMFYLPIYRWETIIVYYNIEENQLYYKDKNKDIAIKKDLSRSLEMMANIILRLYYYNSRYTLVQDNVNQFISTTLICGNTIPQIKYLLLGTSGYNDWKFRDNVGTLGIEINDDIYKKLDELRESNSVHISNHLRNI